MNFYKRFLMLICYLFALTLFNGFVINSQTTVLGFGVQKYRISPYSVSPDDTFDTLSQNQTLNVLNDDGFPQNFVIFVSDASFLPSIDFFCQGQKVDISGNINFFNPINISSRSSEKYAIPITGIKLEEGKNYEFRSADLSVSFTCKSSEKPISISNNIDKLKEILIEANFIINNYNDLVYEQTLLDELKSLCRGANTLISNNQFASNETDFYIKSIEDVIKQLEKTKKLNCVLLQNDLFLGFSMSKSGNLELNPGFLQYGKCEFYLITTEKLSEENNNFISIQNQTTKAPEKITVKYKNAICAYNNKLKFDLWYTPVESELPSGNSFCLEIKKGVTFNNGQTAVLISNSKFNYSLIRSSDHSLSSYIPTKTKIEEEQNKKLTDILFSTRADITEFLSTYNDFIKLSPDETQHSLILAVCKIMLEEKNGVINAQMMSQEEVDSVVKKIHQTILQINIANSELSEEESSEEEIEYQELDFKFKSSSDYNPKVGDYSNVLSNILLILSSIAILILLAFQLAKSKSSYRP